MLRYTYVQCNKHEKGLLLLLFDIFHVHVIVWWIYLNISDKFSIEYFSSELYTIK